VPINASIQQERLHCMLPSTNNYMPRVQGAAIIKQ